jgi:hypothetical protein
MEAAMEPVPQLQHSKKFVKKDHAAVVRQTTVTKGDFQVSRRSAHAAFYLTKCEVKGNPRKNEHNPVFVGQNRFSAFSFTPD